MKEVLKCEICQKKIRKFYKVPFADTPENLKIGITEYHLKICGKCLKRLKEL